MNKQRFMTTVDKPYMVNKQRFMTMVDEPNGVKNFCML